MAKIKKFNLNLLENIGAEVISAEQLHDILSEAEKKQKPLNIKLGMDPTSPDLHLGHYVVLKIVNEFLESGHNINIIIGDFTAKIGDPSGRNIVRPVLSDKDIKINVKTYIQQLSKALDVKKIKVFYNSKWFLKMKLDDILKLAGMFSLNRILDREDFKNRLNSQLEIRANEILYPMMQAHDSVVLKSDVEIGGIDQKLNILAGRQLQEASRLKPQVAILAPLLIGLDGHKKMSKSMGNYIGLNDKPEDMYGKVMSLKDALMSNYFKLVLGYSDDEVYAMEKKIKDGENPMAFKKQLAYEIVETFYSKKEADVAGGSFTKVFSNREIPEEMPEVVMRESSAPLFEIIRSGIPTEEMTSSEIKRLIMQNSIKINDKAISDPYHKIKLSPGGVVIKIGKRRWLKAIGK